MLLNILLSHLACFGFSLIIRISQKTEKSSKLSKIISVAHNTQKHFLFIFFISHKIKLTCIIIF